MIFVCFLLFLCTGEVHARLLDQDTARRLCLTDRPDLNIHRYREGLVYSRFPRKESKLRIYPNYRRDPLSYVYSRSQAVVYIVRPDDTLRKIARSQGTTVELIRELNDLQGSFLKIGWKLWVWDQPFVIEIDKTLNRMYLKTGDRLIKEYPVSTGKSEAQTPLGVFFIQSRYPYPTWFHKGVVIPGGSPENYLGTRWLGFDKPQFGIHGTIFPEQIGQSVSKGCVRMKNEDVEELYEFIPVGTVVIIKETGSLEF